MVIVAEDKLNRKLLRNGCDVGTLRESRAGKMLAPQLPVATAGIPANTTKYLYYLASGQVVEERWNGMATAGWSGHT